MSNKYSIYYEKLYSHILVIVNKQFNDCFGGIYRAKKTSIWPIDNMLVTSRERYGGKKLETQGYLLGIKIL